MRGLILTIAALSLTAMTAGPTTAQEAAETLTLQGCLAQETDMGETEYVLRNVSGEEAEVDEIRLLPQEDMNLAPHVGHTVEVSGTKVSPRAEHEGEMHEEEKADAGHGHNVALRVQSLTHISATCSDG